MKAKVIKADFMPELLTDENCYIVELCNSAAEEQLSIARARLAPGMTTERHRLDGIIERYLISEGKGRVEIGDLPATDIGAGDVVIIPAGIPQRVSNTGDSDLIFYCLCTPRFKESNYHRLG